MTPWSPTECPDFSVSTTVQFTLMFYYPRSKAHNWKAKPVPVQSPNPATPGNEANAKLNPPDQDDRPLTAITAPLPASGTHRRAICDTEPVWHIAAPLECLWAARGTCPQETTAFPNNPLWRKRNNQPIFKPLFLRAPRSFKANQLITQLALKKKKKI